jgi:acyl-coenzyme A synthetase/AMP-(fatty) acid ligase
MAGFTRFTFLDRYKDAVCPMPVLSYSRGPDAPLLEKTIAQVLSEMAARLPAHEAVLVRHQHARLTYRQLQQSVESVAQGLTGLGLTPGDRIGVWASGCVEWVLLFLACARTGIVQVNVNPGRKTWPSCFENQRSRLCFCTPGTRRTYGRPKVGRAIQHLFIL